MDPELAAKLTGPEGVEFAIATASICLVLVPLLITAGVLLSRRNGVVAWILHAPFALFFASIAGLMFVNEAQFAVVTAFTACAVYVLVCFIIVRVETRSNVTVYVWERDLRS